MFLLFTGFESDEIIGKKRVFSELSEKLTNHVTFNEVSYRLDKRILPFQNLLYSLFFYSEKINKNINENTVCNPRIFSRRISCIA